MEKGTVIEGEVLPTSQMNLQGFLQIPAVRQVSILLGVAAAVAAGVAIVLWSQAPSFTRLYSDLQPADAADVVDALRALDIEYRLDTDTGTVLIPESRLHAARLELASQGLPQGGGIGMESLKEQPTLGQSQFRETALYQHALEAELARTISFIGSVRDARVHLALPKQSAFIRDRKPASASVMLSMFRGRTLETDQAASIVNLVASSVPDLTIANVTVIDQHGRLLSSGDENTMERATNRQFEIAERLENNYKRRIEELLTPLVGAGRVRAEVVADLDFTEVEETRELFDPANAAVVSESVTANESTNGEGAVGGIPGAVGNQPVEAGGAPAGDANQGTGSRSTSNSATRNFEVDRTVSHTRPQVGTIRRLSVAVLIDDSPVVVADPAADADADAGDDAEAAAPPAPTLTPEDIERFTALIREAVGFDEARGDTVAVVNAAFLATEAMPEPEEPGLLDNPVLIDGLKQVLGALLALAVAFGLVRPMLKSLVAGEARGPGVALAGSAQVLSPSGGGGAIVPTPSFDEKVAAAKNISAHDPAKVAQVVQKWVASDES